MSMKLPAMFDQNPSHTVDKIVEKTDYYNKKRFQSLTLSPNVKVIADYDLGNKKHATQEKVEQGFSSVIGMKLTRMPTLTAVK